MAIHNILVPVSYIRPHQADCVHYYDQHPTRDDLMDESAAPSNLIFYLLQVLRWLYRNESWFVATNLNIYRQPRRHEHPLAPDVAVFSGARIANPANRSLRSWRLYTPNRPPPSVVIEIASEETWREDVEHKPAAYAAIGVEEYYAYDPNEPAYRRPAPRRMRGWWNSGGVMHEQTPDTQGRLWSAMLDSWLLPNGPLLHLYDRDGQQRLTEGEAERAAKEAAWAKLRELGIDPEGL